MSYCKIFTNLKPIYRSGVEPKSGSLMRYSKESPCISEPD